MFWVLLICAAVLYLLYIWMTMRPRNFPPGPPYFPIIGSTLFIPRIHFHLAIDALSKKYGPLVGLFLGHDKAISVCDPSTVLEVLKREEFQGRPDNQLLQERNLNKRLGIMFNDGAGWNEQRRFTLRQLKDFGFGKMSMEGFVMEEIQELSKELENKTVQVGGLFNLSIINVLWSMMGGTRYKRDDPHLLELLKNLTELFRAGTFVRLVDILPFLMDIIPEIVDPVGTRVLKQFEGFIKRVINEHRNTLNDDDDPRDFIDAYLKEMNKQPEAKSSFKDEMLIAICLDLFAAGAESVGNSLGFAMLYMVLYPEVQKKVQKEIDSHLGRAKMPTLQDRYSLPYTEAVILEIQRVNTIGPIAVPHRVTRDTELRGYFIPKNTMVFISLYHMLQDKTHWDEVACFKPERFLNASGKIIKDDQFYPFGIGKRSCPGEAFARNNLFLFFTSLMQKFTVTLPAGHSKPEEFPLPGFTTAPQPFEATFSLR